jgi:signal transduction histidine kinase
MFKYCLLISLFFFCATVLFGQSADEASLKVSNSSVADSLQHINWEILVYDYSYLDPKKALLYLDSIQGLSGVPEERRIETYYTYILIPMALLRYEYESIMTTFQEGKAYCEKNEGLPLSRLYYTLSVSLYYLDKDEEALESIQDCINELEKEDDEEFLGTVFLHLGNIHLKNNNLDKAFEYFEKSRLHFEQYNEEWKIPYIYDSIGELFVKVGRYEEAETYILKALEVNENRYMIPFLERNLGNVYVFLEKFELAEMYLLSALKYLQKEETNEIFLGETLKDLSKFYLTSEKYSQAIQYANLAYSKPIPLLEKKECVEIILKSHIALKEEAAAIDQYQLLTELNDSIHKENLAEKIRETDNKYNAFRKEKEVQEVKLELAQRDLEKNRLFFILFSLLGILFFSFLLYKKNKDKNSELAELNQQISVKNNDLKKTNEQLNYFNYGLSHDTKQFVNNILNYTTVIREFGNSSVQKSIVAESIENIQNNGWKLKDLIDNLLILSKIKNEESDVFRKRPVNLNVVVAHVMTHLEQSIEESEIEIIISDLPIVQANKTLVFHVFLNLINNAIRYQHPQKQSVIKVETVTKTKEIEIQLIDNGIGIAEANIEQIFLPFNKGNKSYVGSSGLGLSIVKKIIDIHQWKIKVKSEENVGSTFSIGIPATDFVSVPNDNISGLEIS